MESIFDRNFLKIYTAFEKSTRGKWKMDLFSNRLILGDPGAVSRVDKMFVVKVYCKIENSVLIWKSVEQNHYPFHFENFWKELCSKMAWDILTI